MRMRGALKNLSHHVGRSTKRVLENHTFRMRMSSRGRKLPLLSLSS